MVTVTEPSSVAAGAGAASQGWNRSGIWSKPTTLTCADVPENREFGHAFGMIKPSTRCPGSAAAGLTTSPVTDPFAVTGHVTRSEENATELACLRIPASFTCSSRPEKGVLSGHASRASARYVARRAGMCGECAACRCWCALLVAGEPLRVRARLPHRCRGFPPSLELWRYTAPGVHLDSGLPNAYARPLENRAVVAVLVAVHRGPRDAGRVHTPSSGHSRTGVNCGPADS